MFTHQARSGRVKGYRSGRTLAILCGLLGLMMLSPCHAAAVVDPTADIIREKTEQLRYLKALKISDTNVISPLVIPDFYERREFRLVWQNPSTIDDLFRAIHDSEADGLEPRDYHLAALTRLRRDVEASATPSPELQANFDILL